MSKKHTFTRVTISDKQMKSIVSAFATAATRQIMTGATLETIKPGSININVLAKKTGVKKTTLSNYMAKTYRTIRIAHGLQIAATGEGLPKKHMKVASKVLTKRGFI